MMVILIVLVGLFAFAALYVPQSQGGVSSAQGGVSSGFKVYEDFPGGSQAQVYPTTLLSVTCNTCTGGGTGLTFVASDSVSFKGDTITGGSCSGTVSFSSVGGVVPAGAPVSGIGSASTSPMACPMTAVTVPFSDFSSLPSGSYTLTATLDSSASVTFTHGGPSPAVAAPPVSVSVTVVISDGEVTGVTGSI